MTLAATKASSRHRVRITNKTRLRVTRQPLDDLQESRDDEVVRADVSTAGVDVEDAKEHHLQAILSAAQKQQAQVPSAESSVKSALPVPELVIPVPDHAGTVDSYEQHYPADRWIDPHSYVKVSSVVEECVEAGLNGGFTYYMDEQDQEWLDAQNKLASTLPITPVSAAPRASRRGSMRESAEPPRAFPASYDEFELVMGILELVTEQKAPLLHHDQAYPPFSDYLHLFTNELHADIFSSFKVPIWVPPPVRMASLASAIYPYWKERRTCRKGQRIIPTLNYDESDVKNESYVCFRRREVKAVRKTRHSTANTVATERLQRLKGELETVAELSRALYKREALKSEQNRANQVVFNARKNLADLMRANPSLAEAKDNDLFVDKDPSSRPKKAKVAAEDGAEPRRPGRPSKASRNAAVPPTPTSATKPDKVPALMHPHERARLAKSLTDELENDAMDHDMDDAFDEDSSKFTFRSAPDRAFQSILRPLNTELPSSERDEDDFHYRAVRTRRGRGGLRRVDRRASPHRYRQAKEDDSLFTLPRRPASTDGAGENSLDDDSDARSRRLSQWRFDSDEPVDPDPRMLVDDCSPKYMARTMNLVTGADRRKLYDHTVTWKDEQGTTHRIAPVVDPLSEDVVGKQTAMELYIRAKRKEHEARRKALLEAQAQAQAQAQVKANKASASPERKVTDSTPMDVDTTTPPVAPPTPTSVPPSISTPRLPTSLFVERSGTPNSAMSAAHVHGRSAMQAFHSRGAIHMPCVPPKGSVSAPPLDVGGQGGRFGAAYITAKPGPLPSPPTTAPTPSDASP